MKKKLEASFFLLFSKNQFNIRQGDNELLKCEQII